MKVYVYPADETGCGYYRLIWPGLMLAAQGHDVVVVPPKTRNDITGVINNATGKMTDVTFPADADVICMQRPTHRLVSEMIPLIRAKGTAVVVDMDDDLSCIHPDNPAFTIMHPGQKGDHSWRNAELACWNATAVVVSTQGLVRRYMPHGRGAVLHNCVPAAFLGIDEDKDYQGFGWAGSAQTHPDDLEAMGGAARKLVREGFKYFAVGPAYKVQKTLGLDEAPEAFGTIPFDKYPQEIARLKVGVAPLSSTKFNTAKSWLKPLEYAAVGTPSVISATNEYLRLNTLGIGVVARNERQWYREIKRLLTDEAAYAELREAGRAAANQLTYEEHAWRWLEVWQDAVNFERR